MQDNDLNQIKRRIAGLGILYKYTGSSCSWLDITLAESLLTRIICTRRRPAIPEQGRQRSNVKPDAGRTCTHLKHIIEAIGGCGKYLKDLKHGFTNDDP